MDDTESVPGSKDVYAVLQSDPIARIVGVRLAIPVVLGFIIACLAIVAIIFGPASDSRFIYTDF